MEKLVSKKVIAVLIVFATVSMLAFQNCAPAQIEVSNKLEEIQTLHASTAASPNSENPTWSTRDAVTLIGPQKIILNNGAEATNKSIIEIAIEANGAQEMLITNQADCSSETEWVPFSELKSWNLAMANEINSIFFKFRKFGAPETPCIQASILHDDRPPLINIAEVPEFLNLSKIMVDVGANDGQSGSGVNDIFCQIDRMTEMKCQDFFEAQGLEEGKHTISVRAKDKAGNLSERHIRTFTVDRTPPKIVISGPTGKTATTEAKIDLALVESNKVVELFCKMAPMQADFLPCGPGIIEFKDLATGAYHFFAKAKDSAGNISESELMFEVDLTVPTISFTKSPADIINSSTAVFEFVASNADQKIEKFFCALDSMNFTECSSPHTVNLTSDKEYTFAVISENDLKVRSGTAIRKFLRDSKAPNLSITKGPLQQETNSTVEILLAATDNSGIARVLCYMDQQVMDCTTQRATYQLQDGDHKFQAMAIDIAGNQTATAVFSFRVDSRPKSEINVAMSSLIVEDGKKMTFTIESQSVSQISYVCTTVYGGIVVARGVIDPLNPVRPELTVNADIECRVTGIGKFDVPISSSAFAQVDCGNRLFENGRCVDFKCKEFKLIFPSVSGSGTTTQFKVPARSELGICYVAKIFDAISYSDSELNKDRDLDVKSRLHGSGTSKNGNPWVMNKGTFDFSMGGPRVVKLAGGPNSDSPIKADNFILAGIRPPDLPIHSKQYHSYGTADSTYTGTNVIYFRNEPIPLTTFGSSGTATVTPLVLTTDVDSQLTQRLDLRMLDCGGSREQSEIYLLFQ